MRRFLFERRKGRVDVESSIISFKMEKFVACVCAILVIVISREIVAAETNTAWQYTCNFASSITSVAWSLISLSDLTKTLLRCNVNSNKCDNRTHCAVATINGRRSILNIPVSFINTTGQVQCIQSIDNMDQHVDSDLEVHPINWTCNSSNILRSTQQSNSEIFTTTPISEPSTTANSKTSVISSEVTTTTTKPSTANSESTTKIETPTTVIETSKATSKTSTASSLSPTATNIVSITSSKASTPLETPTTITETSTTASKTPIASSQGSATARDTSTTFSEASTTTERYTSYKSVQNTSSQKPSLTTSDQSTESIHTRDSAGGAPAGAIAGSVVGIIALCFIVAIVFVVYKRRRKRNTCPPRDQSFPAETVFADCVNPVYETSETTSLPRAAQTPGTNCDGSQSQITGTGPSDKMSTTPSTSTSTHEGRDKPVKPERKFLSKSAYILVSNTPDIAEDVYAVVDKPRKSELTTDDNKPPSNENVDIAEVTDGLYAVPANSARPTSRKDKAQSSIN